MDLFDAVCHSFTTLATGGYSTKNASVAYWNSPYVEYMITIFMFIGAINFTLIYFFFKGNFKKLFHDEELRWFFFIAVGAISIATSWVYFNGFETDYETSFRKGAFQVVSLLTTTGFATSDFIPWGPVFLASGFDAYDYLRMCRINNRRIEDGSFCYSCKESA